MEQLKKEIKMSTLRNQTTRFPLQDLKKGNGEIIIVLRMHEVRKEAAIFKSSKLALSDWRA